jgi:ribosomal protein S24E
VSPVDTWSGSAKAKVAWKINDSMQKELRFEQKNMNMRHTVTDASAHLKEKEKQRPWKLEVN